MGASCSFFHLSQLNQYVWRLNIWLSFKESFISFMQFLLNASFQLLVIAYIFHFPPLPPPHGIKISDFWEWDGDIPNPDNRAFYKFLQRKYRQIG